MTPALSNDLRHRLVSAVEGGASRRSAVKRFGVSPSSAIRWMDQWERDGHVSPRPQGGDNRSHRMEAFAAEVLNLVDETPDKPWPRSPSILKVLMAFGHLKARSGVCWTATA